MVKFKNIKFDIVDVEQYESSLENKVLSKEIF